MVFKVVFRQHGELRVKISRFQSHFLELYILYDLHISFKSQNRILMTEGWLKQRASVCLWLVFYSRKKMKRIRKNRMPRNCVRYSQKLPRCGTEIIMMLRSKTGDYWVLLPRLWAFICNLPHSNPAGNPCCMCVRTRATWLVLRSRDSCAYSIHTICVFDWPSSRNECEPDL